MAISAVADDPQAVFIATLARELHVAGLATNELESTVNAIAETMSLPLQILATPTSITLAIGPRWRQKLVLLRLSPGRVNLRRIAYLNDIYDRVRSGTLGYRDAADALSALDRRMHGIAPWLEIPALAMLALGVALLLGGGTRELVVATSIGLTTGIIAAFAAKNRIVDRLFEVIAAFVGTVIVGEFAKFFGPTNTYISIIAGVVVLLPGYSLTQALHELANRDLVAGVARLGKVLSTLLALGCGVLLGLAVVGPSLFAGARIEPLPVTFVRLLLAIAFMAAGLAVDLDARRRDVVWVFLASFVAIMTAHVLSNSPLHEISAFGSAFVCGIVANLGARLVRIPQPIMLVPALLTLVPGSLSYESVLFAFQQNIDQSLTFAANAAIGSVQIVAGLLLTQLLFPTTPLTINNVTRPE